MRKSIVLFVVALILGAFGIAYALPAYLANFNTTYPSAAGTALNTCMLCHASSGPPNLNPYGTDVFNSGFNFQAIESLDSDGDGFTNIAEINAATFPGDPASHPASTPAPAPTPAPTPTPTPAPAPAPNPNALSPMQAPAGTFAYVYGAPEFPVLNSDPAQAMPVSIGEAATEGDTFSVQVSLGKFQSPVDVYFVYTNSVDPNRVFLLKADYTLQPVSIAEIGKAVLENSPLPSGFEAWKKGITGPVNEIIFNRVPIASLPAGYNGLYVLVTQPGDLHNYYFWGTGFVSSGPAIGASSQAAQPPVGQAAFEYAAPAFPSINSDPSQTKPFGLGPVALGGDTLNVQVSLGKFLSPVDLYVAYGTMTDPDKLYLLKPDYTIQGLSLSQISSEYAAGMLPNGFVPWKKNFSGGLDEILLNGIPVSQIPSGTYALYLMATRTGNLSNLTVWSTDFAGTGPDAAALYSQNCAGCHGPLASSSKLGRTASQIQTAIKADFGGMQGMLKGLSDFQLQLISGALSQSSTPMPLSVKTTEGSTLYSQNCAICHGASTTAFSAGSSPDQVLAAINAVPAMKGLGFLVPAQISAIVNNMNPSAMAPPATTDGAVLYSQNCAGCHGPLATSAKAGRSADQITNAINSLGAMSGLKNLTATQVQAIATALASQTPPPPPPTTTDGPTLYANNCAGCHGALATSSKIGRTAAQISAAIANPAYPMGSMSSLTSAQVAAIATALAAQTPPPPPPPPTTTDGPTLYANNCAGCHGALATSSKIGRTAAQISAAIANPAYPMGSLSSLTSAQIAAIATALAGQTPPITPAPAHTPTWYKDHRDYAEKNGVTSCTACHGADLRGGAGPSCYSCHGKKW